MVGPFLRKKKNQPVVAGQYAKVRLDLFVSNFGDIDWYDKIGTLNWEITKADLALFVHYNNFNRSQEGLRKRLKLPIFFAVI